MFATVFLYGLAVAAVLPVIALVVGSVMGRVKVTNCCAVADPSRDLRMRPADETVGSPSSPAQRHPSV